MTKRIEDKIVLVVDDDEMNLQVAKMILERKVKCRVLTVSGGKEAIEILRKQDVSLILLDIMMPNYDGIETLQEIRADKFLSDLPVMMLTASSDVDNIKKAAALGVRDYVKKPFMPAELVERVTKKLLTIDNEELEKILLVGEDKSELKTVQRTLEENFPYEVLTATSIADAIKILRDEEISLILASSQMSFIAGFKLLNFVAKDERLKKIPLAITTAEALQKILNKFSSDTVSDTSTLVAMVEATTEDESCGVTVDAGKVIEPVANLLGEHFDVQV